MNGHGRGQSQHEEQRTAEWRGAVLEKLKHIEDAAVVLATELNALSARVRELEDFRLKTVTTVALVQVLGMIGWAVLSKILT